MTGLILEYNKNALPTELEKRQLFRGYVLKATCPECGSLWKLDLGQDYFTSYMQTGKSYPVDCYCQECDHEWQEDQEITCHLSLELSKKPSKGTLEIEYSDGTFPNGDSGTLYMPDIPLDLDPSIIELIALGALKRHKIKYRWFEFKFNS